MFVNHQHFVGQLVDHQQVRSVGVLLTRHRNTDRATVDGAVTGLGIAGLDGRLGRRRTLVNVLR